MSETAQIRPEHTTLEAELLSLDLHPLLTRDLTTHFLGEEHPRFLITGNQKQIQIKSKEVPDRSGEVVAPATMARINTPENHAVLGFTANYMDSVEEDEDEVEEAMAGLIQDVLTKEKAIIRSLLLELVQLDQTGLLAGALQKEVIRIYNPEDLAKELSVIRSSRRAIIDEYFRRIQPSLDAQAKLATHAKQ